MFLLLECIGQENWRADFAWISLGADAGRSTCRQDVAVCCHLLVHWSHCYDSSESRFPRCLLPPTCMLTVAAMFTCCICYFAPVRDTPWCDVSLWVCPFVCLSAHISQKPHGRISPDFYACKPLLWLVRSLAALQHMYVLLVLWMPSYFHIVGLVAPVVQRVFTQN